MFENLQDRLEKSFKILKGQGQITEINVAETLKDVRRALLDADVNFKIAKTFTDQVKEKALGQDVLTSVSPGQLLVKITHDELTQLMGGDKVDIDTSGNPTVILMAGLQGSGKTTHSGKLAVHLKKKNKNPLLVACDVYRPAAIDQLQNGICMIFGNQPIKMLAGGIIAHMIICIGHGRPDTGSGFGSIVKRSRTAGRLKMPAIGL